MKVVEGQLTRLGSSVFNASESFFSVVEIGDQVLSKVSCKTTLANYLQAGLEQNGSTKLYIFNVWPGRYIVGVELPDGKKYAVKPTKMYLIMYLILGLISIFIYVGILFFILAYFEYKDYSATLSAIKADGAIMLE